MAQQGDNRSLIDDNIVERAEEQVQEGEFE